MRDQGNTRVEENLLDLVRAVALEVRPGRSLPSLHLDTPLEEDIGLDSLGRVELMLRIQRRFGLRLPDEAAVGARTPRDLLRAMRSAPATGDGPEVPVQTAPDPGSGSPAAAGTLVEVLDWHAAAQPDRTHVTLYSDTGEGEALSYRQLQRGAGEVAAGLRALGLRVGDTVGIMLPTGMDFFYAFHGILRAGGIPVPLYPPFRTDQIEDHCRREARVLDNAGTPFFIASRETAAPGRLLKAMVPALRHVLTVPELRSSPGPDVVVPRLERDIAFLQYTSGTTGDPKGVVLTHGNLLANIRAMGQAVEVRPDDRFVSWLPLYHDMGLIGACFGTLYFGIHLVLMSPLQFIAQPQRWLTAIHRHRGTISAAPNFAYDLCANRLADADIEGLDLGSWRLAFNGAEPVSPVTIERFCTRFEAHGFRPQAMKPVYGLAESSVGLSFPTLSSAPRIDRIDRKYFQTRRHARPAAEDDPEPLRVVGCGRPLPGHDVRVVDDSGEEVAEREEGRLVFRGPSCTPGYYRNRDATRRLYHDGWLDSGDLAYIADGEIHITGRVKDLIIRAGRNLYPYELEQVVSEVPGIRKNNVAAFACRDPEAPGERLVIMAETRETGAEALREVQERVRQASLRVLDTPPDDIALVPPGTVLKTSSGKIRRAACRQRYESGNPGRRRRAWLQIGSLLVSGIVPSLQRLLGIAARTLFAVWAWLVLVVLFLPTAVLLIFGPGRRLRTTVARDAARLLGWLTRAGPIVEGDPQRTRGPCVVVANHGSYLDGVALRAVLPGPVVFVAKGEFRRNPLIRVLLSRIGAEFVDRFDHERALADLERVQERARRGETSMFFPEGGMDGAEGLQSFRVGAFMVAVRADLPVVPVAIRGARQMLRSQSLLPRPGRISLIIGEPIHPDGEDWNAALRLRDRARDFVAEHCGEPDLQWEADRTLIGRNGGGRL
jgi:1-acyl-sn-glycerol-3-phosphate acyltransferase